MPINPLLGNERVEVGQLSLIAIPPYCEKLFVEFTFANRFEELIPNTLKIPAKIQHNLSLEWTTNVAVLPNYCCSRLQLSNRGTHNL